jgi:hypothetical protein
MFPPNEMPSKYRVYVYYNLLFNSLFAQLSLLKVMFLVEY